MLDAELRTVLRRYPATVWLWLLLPGTSWRSRILPVDRPALAPLRRAAMLAMGLILVVGLGVSWNLSRERSLSVSVESVRRVLEPPAVSAAPVAVAAVSVSAGVEEPSPEIAPEPEPTLAERRTQPALFGSAKVTAVYQGHSVGGVRVEKVDPGSFWSEVGVRSGDVVIARNGDPIDTPAAMVALLNAMERDGVIRLRVRGPDADERTLYYSPPR